MRSYAAALASRPDDVALAERALLSALSVGDWSLAEAAERSLAKANAPISLERGFWRLARAARARDWQAADAAAATLELNAGLAPLMPIVRAWLVEGRGRGDASAPLASAPAVGLEAYWSEHRALLLLARGKESAGLAALRATAAETGARATRLKLAAAAALGRREALALLAGDDPALVQARALLAQRKKLPGGVDTAAAGLAELFARFAVDLHRRGQPPLSLHLAQLSTFLAPSNSETWLIASELLAARGNEEEALHGLRSVKPDDPFAHAATEQRARLLLRLGRLPEALRETEASTRAAGAGGAAWVTYGQLLLDAKRYGEAADAFAKARAMTGAGTPAWSLTLYEGSALEEAGRWREAKAALEAAHRLAPAEAHVLNYLGYAQLERRENLVEAERLIREAHRLQPDDASITDSLGWALHRSGRTLEAIPVLERASAADASQGEIAEHLGDAYWTVGRRRDARFAWRAAQIHFEDADAARVASKLDWGLTAANAAP